MIAHLPIEEQRMKKLRTLSTTVLVIASFTGCHHEEEHTASWVHISNASFGDGKSSFEFQSTASNGDIVIDPQVPSEYKSTVVDGVEDPSNGYRVRGRVIQFGKGELRIGNRSYGPLTGKVHIEIRPNGVLVNGESRGELEP